MKDKTRIEKARTCRCTKFGQNALTMKRHILSWTFCWLGAFGWPVVSFAEELHIPFAGFEPGVERLEFWKPYRFGQGSSFERISTTKNACSGLQALALSVASGGGGQGVLLDLPLTGVREGAEICFGAQVRLDEPGHLSAGSVNLHVELLAGDKPILRTDRVGSTLPVNAQNATTDFKDVEFRYRVDPAHLFTGRRLDEVTTLRLIIVALQPLLPGPHKLLGTVFIDDVSASVTAP